MTQTTRASSSSLSKVATEMLILTVPSAVADKHNERFL